MAMLLQWLLSMLQYATIVSCKKYELGELWSQILSTLPDKRKRALTQQFADYFTRSNLVSALLVIIGFLVVTCGF